MKKLILATLIYITLLSYFGEKPISKINTNDTFKGELTIEKVELKQKTMRDIFDDIDKFKHEQELKKKQEEERKRKELEKKRKELERKRSEEQKKRYIKIKLTGYCPCPKCCGEWAYKNPGITASGTKARFGTVAAPKSIPFGTKMRIEGYGDKVFTVEDTGSSVVERNGVYVIDMWMPTHSQAYNVGNKIVNAEIISQGR